MTDVAEGVYPHPARFPALDPEPSRRPWGRRAAVALGAAVLAGAAVGAAIATSGGSGRARSAGSPLLAGVNGRIVVQGTAGGLELIDPNGTHATALPSLGLHTQAGTGGAESPDGRLVVLDDGTVLDAEAGAGLAVVHTPLKITDNESMGRDPFADHDLDVVVQESPFGYPSPTAGVILRSVATGQSVSLGAADAAAGDPQTPGAFVSVAAGGPQAGGGAGAGAGGGAGAGAGEGADSRVERRQAGRPPVVLATAAALNRDLNEDPGQQVQLIPYPDPSGDQVAIAVFPVTSDEPEGLVLLTRTGRVVGTLAEGPEGGITWSPHDDQVAYLNGSSGQDALQTWQPGSAPVTHQFVSAMDHGGTCLWSPDGSSLLCSTFSAVNSAATGWEVAPPGGAPMVAVAAAGRPIAWLPSTPPAAPAAPAASAASAAPAAPAASAASAASTTKPAPGQ